MQPPAHASGKVDATVGARELLVEEHFSCCCMRTQGTGVRCLELLATDAAAAVAAAEPKKLLFA